MSERPHEPERSEPTTTKTVRFRVRNGCLEPLEPVQLIEGSEIDLTVRVAEASNEPPKRPIDLHTWDLGPMAPLAREQIYEDLSESDAHSSGGKKEP